MQFTRSYRKFVLIFALILGSILPTVFTENTTKAADLTSQNVITDVWMDDEFNSRNGKNQHTINIYGTFSIPDKAEGGDTFQLEIDKKLSLIGSEEVPIRASNGIIIGDMVVSPNSGLVTFTLNENVEKYDNISGRFMIEQEIDRNFFTAVSYTHLTLPTTPYV